MFRENLENGTARRLQRCIIEIFPRKILFDEKYSYTVRISSINLRIVIYNHNDPSKW